MTDIQEAVVARFATSWYQKSTYRHWSVSLWRDPDDIWHCRILSPNKTEWRLISATLCRWRRCFVSDQLWLMIRIREEEDWLQKVKVYQETKFRRHTSIYGWDITTSVFENKRPPYWNSTSGFDLDHFAIIGVTFCIRLPNFVQIRALIAKIWRHRGLFISQDGGHNR